MLGVLNKRTFRVCSGPSLTICRSFPGVATKPSHSCILVTSFLFFRFPQQCSRDSAEDESGRDSRGQAVQGVQGEEDVRLALESARPVPHQLAALQVWRDVLHADGHAFEDRDLPGTLRDYVVTDCLSALHQRLLGVGSPDVR